MNWFLYDRDLRHSKNITLLRQIIAVEVSFFSLLKGIIRVFVLAGSPYCAKCHCPAYFSICCRALKNIKANANGGLKWVTGFFWLAFTSSKQQ